MPGGIPVTSYADFVKDTGPFTFTSPTEMINDAAKQKTMFKWFLKGRQANDVVQGGQYIQDILMLRDKATFEMYNPGDPGTPTQPQTQTLQTEYWRWSRDHMAWQDEVVELNAGQMSDKARFAKYKDFKRFLNMQFYTSLYNGMDSKPWASPHGATAYAAMEGATGNDVKSILAFVNEDTTNFAPNGWTNIHGVPATTANYRNQVRRYDYNDPSDLNQRQNGLFDAFQRMHNDLKWEAPGGGHDEYFTESDPKRCVIFCSKAGHAFYCKLAREANNILRSGPADGGVSGPNFLGSPLEFHPDLDTTAGYLYSTSSTASEVSSSLGTGTWASTDWTRGYRYYFLDFNYLRAWFNDTFYFKMDENLTHMNSPGLYVSWVRTGWNLFCRSRKRLGVVGPGGSSSLTL